MKHFIIASILLFSTALFQAQTTLIPDTNFEQALIDLGLDNVLDGGVLTASISGVTDLYVDGQNISDLTGIDDFTALTVLFCNNNQLTSLGVAQNTALEFLQCADNQLTSLDVSQNTALEFLHCFYNQLTSINVTQNTALTRLDCRGNTLTSLDVSQNMALSDLSCDDNQLTSFNVTQNATLTSLICENNQLTSLDVAQNIALELFNCSNNGLTSLDVSQNTALAFLHCSFNQLTSLDVSQNTALTLFSCSSNQLTSLDITQNTTLYDLYCDDNQLTHLDVSQNAVLIHLYCNSNQLTCLNVANGNNINISGFSANGNPNLSCIEVDDVAYSTTNWTNIDAGASFSTNCPNSCFHSINENNLSSLSIYPNPSNTGLIQTNTDLNYSDIKIYSIEGKQINFTKTNNVIDISDNEKGVYLISIDGVVMRYVYQE